MFLIVEAVEKVMEIVLTPERRIPALIIVFVSVLAGVIFYIFVTVKSKLAQKKFLVAKLQMF